MKQPQKTDKTATATDKKKSKPKKTLVERVHEHLTDKNDVITDEDIKNIQVGEDSVDDASKTAETLAKALEEKKITSSWSILSEEDK